MLGLLVRAQAVEPGLELLPQRPWRCAGQRLVEQGQGAGPLARGDGGLGLRQQAQRALGAAPVLEFREQATRGVAVGPARQDLASQRLGALGLRGLVLDQVQELDLQRQAYVLLLVAELRR